MDGCLRIPTLGKMFKLRISCVQISEGLAHAVMSVHQWMSLSEHTNVLSHPLWKGKADTPQTFASPPRVMGSNVGVQMSAIIIEPSTVSSSKGRKKNCGMLCKHAFIYRNGVH